MRKPMHVDEFLKKLRELLNYNTAYLWGTFGQPLTRNLVTQKAAQYPSFYTASVRAGFNAKADMGSFFAFDCVGIIKAVLWGWSGNRSHGLGGASYPTTAAPQLVGDINANQMMNLSRNRTTDFSRIKPGWMVHVPGHIGIYLGGGVVIEATNGFSKNVLLTACLNIGPIAGMPGRRWTTCGELPDTIIDYKPTVVVDSTPFYKVDRTLVDAILLARLNSPDGWRSFIDSRKSANDISRFLEEYTTSIWGGMITVGGLKQGDRGENVVNLQRLLNEAASMSPRSNLLVEDGSFGPNTLQQLRIFLTKNGLPATVTHVSSEAERLLNIASLLRAARTRGNI